MEEAQTHLAYRGAEGSWTFVNGQWESTEAGEMINPAPCYWSIDTYVAFYTQRAYRDCTLRGRWRLLYAGGACPALIVRAMDSRRFYAVRFSAQMNLPSPDHFVMTEIWKGSPDGYWRLQAYRRKVGILPQADPTRWFAVAVECIGPEIIVYFEDSFVCSILDREYEAGAVGVACTDGKAAWKDLSVEGRPIEASRVFEKGIFHAIDARGPEEKPEQTPGQSGQLPKQFRVAWDPAFTSRQSGAVATLLPGEEILVGYTGDGGRLFQTRSRDFGFSWDKPTEGPVGPFLPTTGELWSIRGEHDSDVVWHDRGTNFDELTMDNFWTVLSRSADGGQTWGPPERLALQFPPGRAYAPIKGKAGAVLSLQSDPHELCDGSVACTAFWRNNPDGNYHSDQVQFLRTVDKGKTWTTSPVDGREWERNESSWVELSEGELLCVMRSNYDAYLGVSRSRDKGRTWSRMVPVIPFFGASCPAIIRTHTDVLVLATRMWGIFTSTDNGYTWSLPTHIGGYTGSGIGASLLEMADGRILVVNATHGNSPQAKIKAQFIRVDQQGQVQPELPGPQSAQPDR